MQKKKLKGEERGGRGKGNKRQLKLTTIQFKLCFEEGFTFTYKK